MVNSTDYFRFALLTATERPVWVAPVTMTRWPTERRPKPTSPPTVLNKDLLAVFASALLIGLSIAAPVGPIGLLTIQRSLEHGPRAGLATGLGAAAADAVYGAVGAYGVSWLIGRLVAARVPLALFGAAFLLWMAWGLVRAEVTGMLQSLRRRAMAGSTSRQPLC